MHTFPRDPLDFVHEDPLSLLQLSLFETQSSAFMTQITYQFPKERSHELEAVNKAKLIPDFNFSRPFLVDVRANNDIFAEAEVLFFIIWNTFDASLAFTKKDS